MAHELELNVNGQAAMFFVGQKPWHGLGVELQNPPTIQEAIIAANLNWTVGTKPLFTADGEQVEAKATYRQSDGKILGVVGTDYKVLQNIEAFNFFQPFLDSKMVTLETAGSLKGGKRIWVLGKITGMSGEVVPGDHMEAYVLLSNAHDGTQATRVGFCPIRVVCRNTEQAAINDKNSKLIRLIHRGDIIGNLESVRETMNLATQQFEATMTQYRALAAKQINIKDLEQYVKIIFQTKQQAVENKGGDRVFAKILPLFESGMGTEIPGVRGSLWAAYNSVTEFLQHERGTEAATRLDSAWFGQSAALNKKAFEVAMDMTQVA